LTLLNYTNLKAKNIHKHMLKDKLCEAVQLVVVVVVNFVDIPRG